MEILKDNVTAASWARFSSTPEQNAPKDTYNVKNDFEEEQDDDNDGDYHEQDDDDENDYEDYDHSMYYDDQIQDQWADDDNDDWEEVTSTSKPKVSGCKNSSSTKSTPLITLFTQR